MALAEPRMKIHCAIESINCILLVVDLLCRNILADALIGGDHLFQGGHLNISHDKMLFPIFLACTPAELTRIGSFSCWHPPHFWERSAMTFMTKVTELGI